MSDVMKGIKVLEVAEHTFVPAASAVLAEWGAEVIKVEHITRGDAMRGLGSSGVMDLGKGVHVLYEHSNRGKRSIALDLTLPEGLEVLYELVKACDVFLTNKTLGVARKLKVDVDDVRAHNPKIIYARGSAYGTKGPEAEHGGYDMTGFWCRGGSAASCTPPDIGGAITQPGPAYGDSMGAMTIAGGISAALFKRERTGEPSVVDVSLLSMGTWAMGATMALSQQMGQAWQHAPIKGPGLGFGNPLVGTFLTKDDRYLNLTMLQAFKYWPDFCNHIDRPELAADPRFDTHEHLTENAAEAREIVVAALATKTLAEWRDKFFTLKGQWAPLQNVLELAEDPQVRANGYVAGAETSGGTAFELAATPVQFDEKPMPTRRGPDFNEHGDDILQEIGLDWEKIIELKTKGAVA
ncbi:MAG: CoA transferase [Candidatus Binatia bacterium]|nr:CoA transferase [Candidatus Binatia bacterium]